MILVSQDGLKAIDSNKVNYFYATKTSYGWNIIAVPEKQFEFPAMAALIMFSHHNEDVVKKMLWYIQVFSIDTITKIAMFMRDVTLEAENTVHVLLEWEEKNKGANNEQNSL